MLENILYRSDMLKGLFTQEEFEFLKEKNSRIEEMQVEIKIADFKRNKIIEKIEGVNTEIELINKIDSEKLKEYVDKAEEAFKSVNNVIESYNKNLEEFNSIETQVFELVAKKDRKALMDMTKQVKSRISILQQNQKKLRIQNQQYIFKIDEFLNNTQIDEILKKAPNIPKPIIQENRSSSVDFQIEDKLELRVSEKERRVYLPYTKSEVLELLENYPDEYRSAREVIEQEFISDISIYNKHPVLARFREAYSLSRNKEMKSTIDSLKFAMDMMFKSYINPTIIAAVKSQKQLESYIQCLQDNKLESFKYFSIRFEVNPI